MQPRERFLLGGGWNIWSSWQFPVGRSHLIVRGTSTKWACQPFFCRFLPSLPSQQTLATHSWRSFIRSPLPRPNRMPPPFCQPTDCVTSAHSVWIAVCLFCRFPLQRDSFAIGLQAAEIIGSHSNENYARHPFYRHVFFGIIFKRCLFHLVNWFH